MSGTAKAKEDWRVLDPAAEEDELASKLQELLVGQPEAIEAIVPCVQAFNAGLSPEGRPVGVVLMLGPTGTGKTFCVESLAKSLHGSHRSLLRIDCGEFQMDHDIAKLVGAPPGYLGHRETPPQLSQPRINAVTSANSDISLILFDEIEKAAPTMTRILLGILDKATVTLGDTSRVCFERSMIFMTSNVGADEIRETSATFGLASLASHQELTRDRVERIGIEALKKRFSPEFVNRIDKTVVFRSLGRQECEKILEHLLTEFQTLINTRIGNRRFTVETSVKADEALLNQGVSKEYGARELRRTMERALMQPVAALVAQGKIHPGAIVMLDVDENGKFAILIKE
jgi:ATP-dependent Clp protease ATP-binding subunit ClpA